MESLKNYVARLIYSRAKLHAGISMICLCASLSLAAQSLSQQDIESAANKYLPTAISGIE
jgi:hypothetical protein